ncbi:Hypothetical predicted protein [Octopus vulgaris]|uniref:Uncharacterized protein n=1 Tax=Octopus vulgaris TaxID=6645 RepID=A0AA36FF54_OCTVU|nr:Hypothetical predicted protein [Octopus vulgaris]
MFHSANIHMVQRVRRPNALRTYFASSSIIPGKEPFRRGVLFSTVAGIMLTIGGLLTWMSFNKIFGARASMMGPLLIALSLGLMFFSLRQFLIARKQSHTAARERIRFQALSREAVAAMVINREDGIGAVTVIMDTVDMRSDASWRSAPSMEYAPPSYSEVLQRTHSPSSSSVPQLSPPDRDSEPPPSYDEAVAALHCRNTVTTEPSPQYTEYITHEHLIPATLEPTEPQSSPLTIQTQQPFTYCNSSKEDTSILPTVTG